MDTFIYLNQPRQINWAIVCENGFSRTLNPEYNIHIRTAEDGVLKEPLQLLSIKQYSRYCFEAEFIDFEECRRQGIDAIEYAYTADHRNEDVGDKMDMKMMEWDCDSILILNFRIILRDSFLTETTEKYLMKG